METSTTGTRDQLAANVVHVAAAKSPFRVDSTAHLLPSSPDDAGGHDDDEDALPSVSSPLPSNTTTAYTVNCGADRLGCCPSNFSGVGLPAVTPHRPDVTAVCYAEMTMNASNRTLAANHDPAKPTSDVSLSHDVGGGGGGGDTVADDMVTFRAALDAVDQSALVGLRRARSKSVLVPVCRPPPAAVRFRSRGSVQCDQVTRDDDDVDVENNTRHNRHQRLYQQQQQTAKSVQTSVSYTRERFRSASLATQRQSCDPAQPAVA